MINHKDHQENRALPWVTAALGLAVTILNIINSHMFYGFLKEQPLRLNHAYNPHFPAEDLISLIGFALFLGGVFVGLKRINHGK